MTLEDTDPQDWTPEQRAEWIGRYFAGEAVTPSPFHAPGECKTCDVIYDLVAEADEEEVEHA